MSKSTVKILKAIADDTRFEILLFLAEKKVASCKDISIKFPKLSQPTMSHHFKILKDTSIISVEKKATENIYILDIKRLKSIGFDVYRLSNSSK